MREEDGSYAAVLSDLILLHFAEKIKISERENGKIHENLRKSENYPSELSQYFFKRCIMDKNNAAGYLTRACAESEGVGYEGSFFRYTA